jgi:putative addiction module killer protein
MQIIRKYIIDIYTTSRGEVPFVKWLESFKDKTMRYRIKERLDRVALGNLGDYKILQEGVSELRLPFGAGYRIYFGQINNKIILLLCGGDKSTQQQDIKKAILLWKDYLMGEDHEKKHQLSRLLN